MKKIFVLFIALLISLSLNAQPCLPNGIIFTTQEQIDNFQVNFPNCTEIQGNVEIGSYGWCDINNLNGLNVLTSIGGTLFIDFTDVLESLKGLNNLESIGGSLAIWQNDSLSELTGLENLTSIGGALNLGTNYLLTNLTGLDNLTYLGGGLLLEWSSLNNIDELETLEVIGGNITFHACTFLNNLSGLENLSHFQGSLTIMYCYSLVNLIGLEGIDSITSLHINHNDSLISLSGLESITYMNGDLIVRDNSSLTSLAALGNIESELIEILNISDNPILQTCEVQIICNHLASNGTAYIENNATGCNSPEEVEDACESVSIDEIFIDQEISIYPNPTESTITIELPSQQLKNTYLTLSNTSGDILISQLITEPQTEIDISYFPASIYIVKVWNDKNMMLGKVIKR